ncbi:MAG: tetratricopeptide repeat protein [Nitrososphaerales archaeon]
MNKKLELFLLLSLVITIICLVNNQVFDVHGIIGGTDTDEKKIAELLKRAKNYLQHGNYDGALAALDVALTISKDSDVLYLKANILEKIDKLEQANSTYYEAYLYGPQNSTINFALSKLLFKMGEYKASIKSMDRALQYDPTNSTLYYEKGKIFLGIKYYAGAIKEFDKAVIIDNKTVYYLAKADTLFNLPLPRYIDALNVYRNITTFIDSKNIAAYLGTAKSHFELKQYDEALNAYDDARKLGENVSKILVLKAQKLNQLQQFEMAKKYLIYIISFYPNSSDAYLSFADALFGLKNYTNALNAYRNITTFIDSKNIAAYLGTAKSHFELKQYDEALNAYDKTIKLGNIANPSTILFPSIEKLFKQKQFEMAKKYLNRIISLSGIYKDIKVYLLLGSISFNDKNYTDALNAYRNITTFIDSKNIAAYLGTAKSMFELKKYDDLLIIYDNMSDLGFDPINIYNMLVHQADKLYKLNNFNMAIKYADKSISFHSMDGKAYFIKGKTLFELKDFKGSRKSYNDALLFDPNNSTLFFYKGNAYAEDKIYKKAMSAYNKALSNNPSTNERVEINNAIKKIEHFL